MLDFLGELGLPNDPKHRSLHNNNKKKKKKNYEKLLPY